ncbi:S1 family peptidase [Cerasicoccus frondis]|uniref:S1 family peptidase n=1 Tax=Cerasicoccus frondis TaxID=490090 RepID=UPI002852D1E2|nr:serine protease [Cerasicoccus frondis]
MVRNSVLTIFLFWLAGTAAAEPRQAIALGDFEAPYPIEKIEGKIYPTERYEFIRELKDSYLLRYTDGRIVSLPKRRSGLICSFREGNYVAVSSVYFDGFDQGYFVFRRGQAFDLLSVKEDKVVILYDQDGVKENLSLPRSFFRIPALEQKVEEKQTYDVHQANMDSKAFEDWNTEAIAISQKFHHGPQASNVTPAERPYDAVCLIECKESTGTGFIGEQDGHIYVFTNLHVISKPEDLRILANDQQLKPLGFEVAQSRDLARILIDQTAELPALAFSSDIELNDPIFVYGNSDGAGVVTEITGVVNGVGFDRVETTAQFVTGNSGSPLVNEDGAVVGVATFAMQFDNAMDWARQNSRFNEARFFAYKVDSNVKWVPVHQDALLKMNSFVSDAENALLEAIRFFEINSKHYNRNTYIYWKPSDQDLKDWVKRHNQLVAAREKAFQSYNGNESIRRIQDILEELERHYEYLAVLFSLKAEQIKHTKIQPDIDFYTENLTMISEFFETVGKVSDEP